MASAPLIILSYRSRPLAISLSLSLACEPLLIHRFTMHHSLARVIGSFCFRYTCASISVPLPLSLSLPTLIPPSKGTVEKPRVAREPLRLPLLTTLLIYGVQYRGSGRVQRLIFLPYPRPRRDPATSLSFANFLFNFARYERRAPSPINKKIATGGNYFPLPRRNVPRMLNA